MKKIIENHLNNLIKTLIITKNDLDTINKISTFLISSVKKKKRIFVYGNGGSFADSSHFVGELTATYKKKRKPLPFFLLGSNIASISAWGNDYNFNDYISRELEAYGSKDDVLIILSTSGGNLKKKQSLNLIKMANLAKKKGIFIMSFLGKGGGVLKNKSNLSYVVRSKSTATIQEVHKCLLHSICELIDKNVK